MISMLSEEKHSRQNYSTTLHYQNMRTILHCQTSAEILLITRGIVRAVRKKHRSLFQKIGAVRAGVKGGSGRNDSHRKSHGF